MTQRTKHREPAADHQAALAQYRRRAGSYDLELAAFEPIRRRAIAALAPRAGETVLDIGCGTGLSFDGLLQGVGAHGHVIGVDLSPQMLARARQRVEQGHWHNVTLLCGPVDAAPIRGQAQAALFHFTHDILRDAAALAHVVSHLAPGARVVATGLQWAPLWALPVNLFVAGAAWYSVTSLDGLACPWSELAALLGGMRVDTLLGGAVFMATGTRVVAP